MLILDVPLGMPWLIARYVGSVPYRAKLGMSVRYEIKNLGFWSSHVLLHSPS